MEPLFVCEFFSTYKMCLELYRRRVFHIVYVVNIVLSCVMAFLLAVALCFGILPEILAEMWYLLLLIAVSFALPYFLAWANIHNSKKQNDGVLPKCVMTVGENIHICEGIVQVTVEYHRITGAHRFKHGYVLVFQKNNNVIIDPNGFTKGTFEEFKQFLRTKRPDLVIPE